ncbi:MAG: glycosyltransferase family 25 protein [Spirochaetales bacterium]|nr:glycosyltransferase family 25 protein [Spirochaetales bacterium]
MHNHFNHSLTGQSSFYDKISCIYYINLPERIDRKQHILTLLTQYFPDKKITRMKAISSKNLEQYKQFYDTRLLDDYRYFNTKKELVIPGIIGCFLSHFFLLKKIQYSLQKQNDGDHFFLVFEDDTCFDSELIDKLKILEEYLPHDWTVIFGLNPESKIFENQEQYSYNKYLCKIDNARAPFAFGNNLLIYNPKKINLLVEQMENSLHIWDYDMMLLYYNTGLYCFKKGVISVSELSYQSDLRIT